MYPQSLPVLGRDTSLTASYTNSEFGIIRVNARLAHKALTPEPEWIDYHAPRFTPSLSACRILVLMWLDFSSFYGCEPVKPATTTRLARINT